MLVVGDGKPLTYEIVRHIYKPLRITLVSANAHLYLFTLCI